MDFMNDPIGYWVNPEKPKVAKPTPPVVPEPTRYQPRPNLDPIQPRSKRQDKSREPDYDHHQHNRRGDHHMTLFDFVAPVQRHLKNKKHKQSPPKQSKRSSKSKASTKSPQTSPKASTSQQTSPQSTKSPPPSASSPSNSTASQQSSTPSTLPTIESTLPLQSQPEEPSKSPVLLQTPPSEVSPLQTEMLITCQPALLSTPSALQSPASSSASLSPQSLQSPQPSTSASSGMSNLSQQQQEYFVQQLENITLESNTKEPKPYAHQQHQQGFISPIIEAYNARVAAKEALEKAQRRIAYDSAYDSGSSIPDERSQQQSPRAAEDERPTTPTPSESADSLCEIEVCTRMVPIGTHRSPAALSPGSTTSTSSTIVSSRPFVGLMPQLALAAANCFWMRESNTLSTMIRDRTFFEVADHIVATIADQMCDVQMRGRMDRLRVQVLHTFCTTCPNFAYSKCLTCNANMCSICVHGHDQLHITATIPIHRKQPVRSMEHCRFHVDNFTVVCLQCCVLTCGQCASHAAHICMSVDQFAAEAHTYLNRTMMAGNLGTVLLRQSLRRDENLVDHFERSFTNTMNAIHLTYRERRVQEAESLALLADADAHRQRTLAFLKQHTDMLTEALANHTAETTALEFMMLVARPRVSNLELVFNLLELHRTITGFMQALTQPMYTPTMRYKLDKDGPTCGEIVVHLKTPRFSNDFLNDDQYVPSYSNVPVVNPYNVFQSNNAHLYHTEHFNQTVHGMVSPVTLQLKTEISRSFGCEGDGPDQVNRAWGVCVDSEGNVIAGDRRNHRVQVFRQDGQILRQFGSHGRGLGQFDLPTGVCVDRLNNIYVADKDNHRVQVFTHMGQFLRVIGREGQGDGEFSYPWDVAVNARFELVVSDSRNARIQLFGPDGKWLAKIGFESAQRTKGMTKNRPMPRGVCFSPTGQIFVTEFEHNRLYRIEAGLMSMACVNQPGENEFLNLNRPSGVCCDDEGRVVVADSKNTRLVIFAPRMQFLASVNVRPTYKIGADLPKFSENDRPCDVAILPNGRLVVLVETAPENGVNYQPMKTFLKIY